MKKTVLFLILAAGLLACSKEPVQQEITSAGEPLKFEINVADFKAAKTAWAEGDVIYVFFQSFSNKYLTLTREADGTWTNTFVGELTAADLTGGLGGDYLTAVYFPVEVKVEYANLEYCFTDKETGGAVYSYYLFDKDREYEVDGSTVRATLQMEKPADVVLFHVAGIQESIDNYTFGCSLVRPMACASVGTDGSIMESLLQPGARLSGFADADGAVFGGRLTTAGSADYTFTLASNDKIYTLKRTGKTLEAGKMYNFPALSAADWSMQNSSDLYVDLGLPSGVKWAKCNLGASTETDYGNYFAWGETTGYNEGKTSFTWNTYAWGTGQTAITKYCSKSGFGKDGFTDRRTTLEKTDDAAYAALGGKFRMPTDEEWIELLKTKTDVENYTWTWCDGSSEKYNGTNVNGWKIVKNSSSATLFIPAAGFMNTGANNVNSRCYYWSSSLDTDLPYDAWYVSILFQKPGVYMSDGQRALGLSVRPVWK